MTQKELAECYQPLFNLMVNEHDLILNVSQMDEIILACTDVSEAINELMKPVCDVEGCNVIPSSGGYCWPDTGHWMICHHHSAQYRNGTSQPKMKQEAIQREASRLPNGCLPV